MQAQLEQSSARPLGDKIDKTSCPVDPFFDMMPVGANMELEFQELEVKQTKENHNGTAVDVVRFIGKITNSNSIEVNRKIHTIFSPNNYNVILDLSRLEYINSSGVAMLFSIMSRIKENKGKIVIGGVHPFLYDIFKLMDLPPRLELYDNVEEAKQVF